MANLTEAASWESGIYQIEETDLVKGGASGTSNVQPKQLANRTLWLKQFSGVKNRFLSIEAITANTTITNGFNGKLAYVNVTANVTLQLDTLVNFNDGDILTIATRTVSGTAVKIQAASLQTINFNGENVDILYLVQQEYIELTKLGSEWLVTDCSPSLLETGDCLDAYKQRPNTLVRMGQILTRSQYPRLWQWCVNKLADGQELLDDAVWLSNIAYQGCFSKGNGTSTFRLPDDRAMFTRYLDLGRGIDYERSHNYAGGYQADQFKSHDHNIKTVDALENTGLGEIDEGGGNVNPSTTRKKTETKGGTETRPKNNAKLPLIKI
jgi:hypothetical protein